MFASIGESARGRPLIDSVKRFGKAGNGSVCVCGFDVSPFESLPPGDLRFDLEHVADHAQIRGYTGASARYLSQGSPARAAREPMSQEYPYNGRLSRWDEVAPGLAIVGVQALEQPFSFEAGQYATLGLMGAEKLIQRPMSVSSSADRLDEYEFFIRHVESGAFTPLLWERKVGDPINIKGPKGRFLLQPDGRRSLFVASGTGLAPFISMIETLRGRSQTRDIVLLHGVSHEHDLAWRAELEALEAGGSFPLRYVATISRPQANLGWRGCTGRVESIVEAQLEAHGLTADNTTLYLCGNPEMITAVDEIATRHGFPPELVRKELYWPKGREH